MKTIVLLIFIVFSSRVYSQFTMQEAGKINGGKLDRIEIDYDGSIVGWTGAKVFKSSDNGSTWGSIAQTGNFMSSIKKFQFDSKNNIWIYAGREWFRFMDNKTQVWEDRDFSNLMGYYDKLELFYINPDDDKVYLSIDFGGLYVSNSSLTNWQRLDAEWSDTTKNIFKAVGFDQDYLYGIIRGKNLWRMSFADSSWAKFSVGIDSSWGSYQYDDYSFVGSLNDGTIVVFSYNPQAKRYESYYSLNQGDSWAKIEYPDEEIKFYKIRVGNTNEIFYQGEEGIYLTTNLGTTWRVINYSDAVLNSYVYDFAIDPELNIYAANRDNSCYKYLSSSTSWEIANEGINTIIVGEFLEFQDKFFVAGSGGGFLRSEGDLYHWKNISTGILELYRDLFVSDLAVFQDTILLGSGYWSYQYFSDTSKNNGQYWDMIEGFNGLNYNIETIGNDIFVVDYFELFRGQNYSYNYWNQVDSWDLLIERPIDIDFDKRGNIYLLYLSVAESSYNIAKSSDKGESWEEVARFNPSDIGDLKSLKVLGNNLLVFSYWHTRYINLSTFEIGTPLMENEQELAATLWDSDNLVIDSKSDAYISSGQFHSTESNSIWKTFDDGETWRKYCEAPVQERILSLFIDENDVLYCATDPSGYFFKIDTKGNILDVENQNLELVFSLSNNYPNPFNPTTTIEYNVPKNGQVNLSVYNSLGQRVETLVNGNKQTGKYNVVFNASNLSSGVYFYRIEAGNYSDVKKMLLLK